MLLGIILLPLLARFSLICRMWAFPIIHVIDLWGEQTGLSFWAGARGLGVSLSLPLLWAWRVGLCAYFSNPIRTHKVLEKEKNIKKNDFLVYDFTVKNVKIKSNIIKIPQKFTYFKIS